VPETTTHKTQVAEASMNVLCKYYLLQSRRSVRKLLYFTLKIVRNNGNNIVKPFFLLDRHRHFLHF